MSKSIKLKDNNYWDTKGVVHNKQLLSNIIGTMNTNISNNTSNISNLNTNLTNVTNRIAGYGEQAQSTDNPNNLGLASGFYRYYGNCGGQIATSWWFIIHIAHYDANGNFARQVWFNYWGSNTLTRMQTGGNWSGFSIILN